MSKGFYSIGHCQKCGDTQGPWSLVDGRWLCDMCADVEEEQQQVNKLDTDPVQEFIEEENNEIR